MNAVEAAKHVTTTTTPDRPSLHITSGMPERLSQKETSSFQDDDNEYCLPQELVGLVGGVERGEGVGAEEERNLYKGGPPAKTPATTQHPSNSSAATLSSPESPDRLGYPFLNEVSFVSQIVVVIVKQSFLLRLIQYM